MKASIRQLEKTLLANDEFQLNFFFVDAIYVRN